MLIPILLTVALSVWPQPDVSGVASWYGNPGRYGAPAIAWYTRQSQWGAPVKFYAAAGPELRKMIGDSNPYHEHYPLIVTNRKTGARIQVQVVDWCSCSKGKPGEKLIDLSPAAFLAVCGPLSRGICSVTVAPIRPPVVSYPQETRWVCSMGGPHGPNHRGAGYCLGSTLRIGDRRG